MKTLSLEARITRAQQILARALAVYPHATLDLSGADPVICVGEHEMVFTPDAISTTGPTGKKHAAVRMALMGWSMSQPAQICSDCGRQCGNACVVKRSGRCAAWL